MKDQPVLEYQEIQILKRSLFEFDLDKPRGNSLNHLAPDVSSQRRSFNSSVMSKRSHSSNRFSSQSRNIGSTSHRAPTERGETNKLWPFSEDKNVNNDNHDDDQKRITGFKNLDSLLIQQEIHQQNVRSAQKRRESREIKVNNNTFREVMFKGKTPSSRRSNLAKITTRI